MVLAQTPAPAAASPAVIPAMPRMLSTCCVMIASLPQLCERDLGPGTTPGCTTVPVFLYIGSHRVGTFGVTPAFLTIALSDLVRHFSCSFTVRMRAASRVLYFMSGALAVDGRVR